MSAILEKYQEYWAPIPWSGCCVWLTGSDRPRVVVNGKSVYVQRIICEETHGPMPRHMESMHSCGNIFCVAPWHLTPGSHIQNMNDVAPEDRSARSIKGATTRARNRGLELGVRQKRGWWLFERAGKVISRHETSEEANIAARAYYDSNA